MSSPENDVPQNRPKIPEEELKLKKEQLIHLDLTGPGRLSFTGGSFRLSGQKQQRRQTAPTVSSTTVESLITNKEADANSSISSLEDMLSATTANTGTLHHHHHHSVASTDDLLYDRAGIVELDYKELLSESARTRLSLHASASNLPPLTERLCDVDDCLAFADVKAPSSNTSRVSEGGNGGSISGAALLEPLNEQGEEEDETEALDEIAEEPTQVILTNMDQLRNATGEGRGNDVTVGDSASSDVAVGTHVTK